MPDVRAIVLTNPHPGEPKSSKLFSNVNVERISPSGASWLRALSLIPGGVARQAIIATKLATFLERERKRRAFVRSRIDVSVVHYHSMSFWRNLASFAARHPAAPLIRILDWLSDLKSYQQPVLFTDHSLFGGTYERFAATRGPELAKNLPDVVCVERSGYNNVRRFAQESGTSINVEYVPNPIDTDIFRQVPMSDSDTLIIGYVGRLEKTGLSIVENLAREAPPWIHVRAALAAPLGAGTPPLWGSIETKWNVPNQALPEFYGSIHIMLDPYEFGLPRTTLEAMSCGRPVLRVREHDAESLPSEISPVINSASPQAIQSAVEHWHTDREDLRRAGRAARQHAEREFSAEIVARRYRSIYEGLLAA